MAKHDKIVLFSKDSRATTAFYEILNGNQKADSEILIGSYSLIKVYIYQLKTMRFESDLLLLIGYTMGTEEERDEVNIRSF
jgi:hypothetical protein